MFYSLFGVTAVLALLIYPEVALALYVVIGDLKGDDRIAALLPVDLTLALGALLLVGISLNLLRHKRVVKMPTAYFLFVALVAIMTASLTYTPVFDAGLEKLGRFLTVTGIVIVAPFFLLGTRRQTVRFFASFAVAAFAICTWSLFALGGSERLATPSNNTIGLGHIACALILILWFAVLPSFPFPRRFFVYPLLFVPVLALIGSGSRGPAIACALVILGSVVLCRSRILDLVCAALSARRSCRSLTFRLRHPVSRHIDQYSQRQWASELSIRLARIRLEIAPAASASGNGHSGFSVLFSKSRALQVAAQYLFGNCLRTGNSRSLDCVRNLRGSYC